jgi:hypothetical protein
MFLEQPVQCALTCERFDYVVPRSRYDFHLRPGHFAAGLCRSLEVSGVLATSEQPDTASFVTVVTLIPGDFIGRDLR